MMVNTRLGMYLQEIRQEVCSQCTERPTGGPPCEPLGKYCGIERYLPELIQSIHEWRSRGIGSLLDHSRQTICSRCPENPSPICPCPLDYFATQVVEAVDTVDQQPD